MEFYAEADTERWAAEPDKRPGRTAFQRDRARVLHSAALRRLAGKTQVVTPGLARSQAWDASPRTRLTHSLECAQVGRELGAALGCDPDLVETACLAHDLGHPPFGHNGEQALNEFAEDCGGFEGNAQSLRLLTRLEPKRFVRSGDRSARQRRPQPHPRRPGRRHQVPLAARRPPHRPGLREVRRVRGRPAGLRLGPAGRPRPTASASRPRSWTGPTTWRTRCTTSRTVCTPATSTRAPALRARAAPRSSRVAVGRYVRADTDPQELAEALDRLLAQEWWPHGYDGSAVAQARLKDATSQLIGRFCLAAEAPPAPRTAPGRLTRYGAELVVRARPALECAVLKAVADRYVMQRAEQERLRADQRVVIAELAEALTARAPDGLDPQFRALFDAAADDRARQRVIVDQIASLTDAAARSLPLQTHRAPPVIQADPASRRSRPPSPITLRAGRSQMAAPRSKHRGGIKWSTQIGHSSSSEAVSPGRKPPRPSAPRASPAG